MSIYKNVQALDFSLLNWQSFKAFKDPYWQWGERNLTVWENNLPLFVQQNLLCFIRGGFYAVKNALSENSAKQEISKIKQLLFVARTLS